MTVIINGSNTPTAGGVTYGDGTQYATTAAGTSGQALISAGASAPTWGAVSAATGLTGVLPVANGGTNSTATPTAGGVGYGTGTAHAYTSAGTAGQALISNGAGAPTWGSAGAMTLISTQTASTSANISWTGLSGYEKYVLIIQNAFVTASTARFLLVIGTGAGPTYITSNYEWSYIGANSAGPTNTTLNARSSVQLQGSYVNPVGGVAGDAMGFNGNYNLSGFLSSQYLAVQGTATYASPANGGPYNENVSIGGGQYQTTGAYTAIKVSLDTGNILSGKFSLYGISS